MWNKILMVAMLFPFMAIAQSKTKQYKVNSPDKKIEFILNVGQKIWLSANYNEQSVLDHSEISMQLETQILGENPKVISSEKQRIDEIIHPIIREKTAIIKNNCNELRIDFKNDFYLILRTYDNGFAYRFGTNIEGEITVISETGKYEFPENHMLWWGKEKQFQSHNQVFFDYKPLRQTSSTDLSSLPLIINPSKGPKIVITETDLQDYPGMWLRGNGNNSLFRVSAKYPKTIQTKSDRVLPIVERENYIAKTTGTRTFPWRVFAVAEKDADLITNQLTYILASSNKIEDTSWIQPGKVAWDWWNANNIYGVDFEAGINTETYKY